MSDVFYLQGGSEAQSVPQEEVPAGSRLLAWRGPGAPAVHGGLQRGTAALPARRPTMPPPGRVKGQGHAGHGEGKMSCCYPECPAVDQSPDQLVLRLLESHESSSLSQRDCRLWERSVVGGSWAVGGSRGRLDEGASCFSVKELIDGRVTARKHKVSSSLRGNTSRPSADFHLI